MYTCSVDERLKVWKALNFSEPTLNRKEQLRLEYPVSDL